MRFPHTMLAAGMLLAIAAPASGADRQAHHDCDSADLDRNIAGCTRIIDDPGESGGIRAIALVGCGLAWDGKGDRDRGMKDFDEAIRLDPKNALAYNDRAILWREKSDVDRALADFTAAIAIDPLPRSDLPGLPHINIYSNRGLAWEAKGELDRAMADFDQAIKLDRNDAEAYDRRARAWLARGDRAEADFTDEIRIDATRKDAYDNRGLILQAKGEPDAAIADFTQAIRLEPNDAAAYLSRGQILLGKNDVEAALGDFDQAIRLDPTLAGAFALHDCRGSSGSPCGLGRPYRGARGTR